MLGKALKDLKGLINRGGDGPKVSRAQIMGARPVRNPAVKWEREPRREDEVQVIVLRVPRRKDRMGNIVAKLFRVPDFRKLELDEIGSDVWEMCDGAASVDTLSKAVCAKYHLNRRQGETSVTAYLKMLAERRLLALRTGGSNATAKAASGGAAAAKAAAAAGARRQKRA